MISVIIPVYNEERALPRTLQRLFEQPGSYETIVVDGGSTDRTQEIAVADPRTRWLTAPKGRSTQMNAGVRIANGSWLLFLHADTSLPPGAIALLSTIASERRARASGFRHRFTGNDWRLRLISRLDNWRCRRTQIIYGDQALFIERELFEKLEGFPNVPILEDVRFGEKLRRETSPLLLDVAVTTDARKFLKMGIWRSFARVLLIILCCELKLPIPARAFFRDVR